MCVEAWKEEDINVTKQSKVQEQVNYEAINRGFTALCVMRSLKFSGLMRFLPGPHEITPINHNCFRESDLRFGVISRKMAETVDERRSKDIGKLLAVH